jgi:hypothetical protein
MKSIRITDFSNLFASTSEFFRLRYQLQTWIIWHRFGKEHRLFLLDFGEQTDYVLVIQVCNEPRGFWNYVWRHAIPNFYTAGILYICKNYSQSEKCCDIRFMIGAERGAPLDPYHLQHISTFISNYNHSYFLLKSIFKNPE